MHAVARRTLPLITHAHEQKKTRYRIVDVVRTCVENVNVRRRRKNLKNLKRGANAAANKDMMGPGVIAHSGMIAPGMMAPGMMAVMRPQMTLNLSGMGCGAGAGPMPRPMFRGVGPKPPLSSAAFAPPPMPGFDDCTRGLVAPQAFAPPTEGTEEPSSSVSVTMQLGQLTDRTERGTIPVTSKWLCRAERGTVAVTSKWLWMMGFDKVHDVEAIKRKSSDGAAASFVPVCPELGNMRTWEPQAGILSSTKPPYTIVAANESWLKRCNLTLEDCAGRTCAILQGEETEKERAVLLMEGIRHLGIDGRPHVISASLTNYTQHEPRRKFHNELSIWKIEHSDSEKKERYFLTLCNMVFPEALQPHLVASAMPLSTLATATVSAVTAAAAAAPIHAPALAAAAGALLQV